jgi:AcrR family transcriptional regulator
MSGPGLRELKKQRTRAAIQQAALRLFTERGYDATTTDQIAAAAEVSPATFFRYFPTKEDVVIQDDYDPLMVAALEDAPADLPPLSALRHAMRTAFAQITPPEQRAILERARLIMSVPALRAKSLDNMVATIDVLAPPMARRLGRPDRDLAVRVYIGSVIGGWLAVVLEWIESDGALSLPDLMDSSLETLESGL